VLLFKHFLDVRRLLISGLLVVRLRKDDILLR